MLTSYLQAMIFKVVGHSLGGALASLMSGYVVDVGIYTGNQVTMVTLGQPRVGDATYASYHDSRVSSIGFLPLPHLVRV